jgi:hypothetical protein
MPRFPLILMLLLALPTCARVPSAPHADSCEPIAHMDWKYVQPDDRAKIEHAAEDYCAVLAGKVPLYAQPDPTFMKPPNSSSRRYVGDGYTVTSVGNGRFLGGVSVAFRGATLRFDAELGAGEAHEISNIRAYGLPPIP